MEPSSDIFPAQCLKPGNAFLDLADGRIFRVDHRSHTPGSWWVLIRRGDGSVKRYYIGEPVRIYDGPMVTDAELSAIS